MTSITFQVISGTKGTATKTYTVSDADIDKLITYSQAQYGGTPLQALNGWANGLMQQTVNTVQTYQTSQNPAAPIVAT